MAKKTETSSKVAAVFAAGLSIFSTNSHGQFSGNINYPSEHPEKIAAALEEQVEVYKEETAGFIELYTLDPRDFRNMEKEEIFRIVRSKLHNLPEIDAEAKNGNVPEYRQIDYSNTDLIAAQFTLQVNAGPKSLALPLKNAEASFACIMILPDADKNPLEGMSYGRTESLPSDEVEIVGTILDHEFGHCASELSTIPENVKTPELYEWYLETKADAYAVAKSIKDGKGEDFLNLFEARRQMAFIHGDIEHYTAPTVTEMRNHPPETFTKSSPIELYQQAIAILHGDRTEQQFAQDFEAWATPLLVAERTEPLAVNKDIKQYSGVSSFFSGLSSEWQAHFTELAQKTNAASSMLLGYPEQSFRSIEAPTLADRFEENLMQALNTLPEADRHSSVAEKLHGIREEERAFLAESNFHTKYDFLVQTENGVTNQAKLEVLSRLEERLAPEQKLESTREITTDRS